MDIVRRVVLGLVVAALVTGCSTDTGGLPTNPASFPPATLVPAATATPPAQPGSSITASMVQTAERLILAAVDSGIEQTFQTCKTRVEQGGGGDLPGCETVRTASLAFRKALVECFARAEGATTPEEVLSAVMRCQLPSPSPS